MNPQPATFQAIGLTRWYGQVIAVNDLSFTADAGIVGLLGPNGAGKSTLIKLLVGQLRPSSGRVMLGGQVPWANPDLIARLGYCPEHDRFYEDLSAFDFVSVLTRLHGYGAARAEALSRAALERVDLSAQADKPVRALSHGMRQRLKLAQALAHRPQILVLDEPLSGLDPIQRLRLISLLRAEAEAGTQVLVSSHVLHELEAMTDHILLINRGRMVAEGAVDRIRALIDDHPHRIALTVDRARELGQVLLGHEDVVRVEVDGERVVIETASPDACYDRIGELACGGEFEIRAMVSLDDNLEAVFRYLVQ